MIVPPHNLSAKPMPPLWQYFLRLRQKPDERISAPKELDPRTPEQYF